MAEDIKDLIEKIHQEGVQAAQEKAKEIEEHANQQAKDIIQKAKSQAEGIIAQAEDKAAKIQESGNASLKQAGRDLLLSLKKEINAMLDKLIVSGIRQSLKPDEMAKIITTLIKDYKGKEKEDIIISLKSEDLQKIEQAILSELKEQIKKGITLRPSEDIIAGFTISYDGGKSHFDFTDNALAEYISSYLKPKLAELLNPKCALRNNDYGN